MSWAGASGASGACSRHPVTVAPSRPGSWLVDRLVTPAGLDRDHVPTMPSELAVDAWPAHGGVDRPDRPAGSPGGHGHRPAQADNTLRPHTSLKVSGAVFPLTAIDRCRPFVTGIVCRISVGNLRDL